jgi:hypothetical protein
LGSFRKINFFTPDLLASWRLGGSHPGSSALEHRERPVEGSIGSHLVAQDRRELGPLALGQHQRTRASEERRFRPCRLPTAPSRVGDDIRKPFLPVIARRQVLPHFRPKAFEAVGLFLGDGVPSRSQPMP